MARTYSAREKGVWLCSSTCLKCGHDVDENQSMVPKKWVCHGKESSYMKIFHDPHTTLKTKISIHSFIFISFIIRYKTDPAYNSSVTFTAYTKLDSARIKNFQQLGLNRTS